VTVTRRIVITAIAASFGWFVGREVGSVPHVVPQPSKYPFLAELIPLPHHVPKYPGGVSFRFAMAHDVIHERFPKFGPAHYQERDRLTREKLRRLAADDPAGFPLADDLGAGLDRLGRSDEAVAVIREKLARQQARGLAGRDLYTSHANLGTFLIHGSFKPAMSGDAAARDRFREGVASIRQSVEVNPEAHFGREQWQAAIAEFLLAAMDDPALLKTFDCLGNRLDLGIEEALNREGNWVQTGYGRPNDAAFSQGKVDDEVQAFFRPGVPVDEPSRWPEVSPIRRHITKLGAESGWEDVAVPSHRSPVPFDEPVLGIIGMWRQGGGANPHFALALGGDHAAGRPATHRLDGLRAGVADGRTVLARPRPAAGPPRPLPSQTGPDRGDAVGRAHATRPTAWLAARQPAALEGDRGPPADAIRSGIGLRRGVSTGVSTGRGGEGRGRSAHRRRAYL